MATGNPALGKQELSSAQAERNGLPNGSNGAKRNANGYPTSGRHASGRQLRPVGTTIPGCTLCSLMMGKQECLPYFGQARERSELRPVGTTIPGYTQYLK